MSSRLSLALVLTLACGAPPTTTTTGDGTTSGSSSTTTDDPTGTPTTTGTTTTTTGGSGTDSATGSTSTSSTTTAPTTAPGDDTTTTEGGGTGGQGSGMACAKWYGAIAESYEPICECDVQKGTYDSLEECLADKAPSPDCACSIFAGEPQTAEILKCYEKAAAAKTDCLGDLNLCIGDIPLDPCILQEVDALLKCGAPSADVCEQLKSMCGEAVPPICG